MVALVSSLALHSLAATLNTAVTQYRMFPTLLATVGELNSLRMFNITASIVETPEEFGINRSASSLRLRTQSADFSGISISGMPQDWQGYSRITFAFYAPALEGRRQLRIRLFDTHRGWRSGEWLTFDVTYQKGSRSISLPINATLTDQGTRQFDWTSVNQLFVFDPSPADGVDIYLSAIRLE